MKKKILNVLLCSVVFFASCAGREPNPISIQMRNDEQRSCSALLAEMANCQEQKKRLKPHTNKFWSNALWITGGVFFIVPIFFVDVKDAEKIEYDAFQRRYDYLSILAAERNCYASDPNKWIEPVASIRRTSEPQPKYRMKKDAAGNFMKNKDGGFIFEPVPEQK